jgi:RNA polymerase sigma-70 factor, ECF subfamily
MMPPEKNEPSDQELLSRALQGDADAFGDIYERYLDEIHRYIYFRVTDRFEAEDLTEMVFLKAWEALPRFRSPDVNLRAWIYRIAHNTVVDHYRTHKPTSELPLEHARDASPLPEHQIQNLDEHERLADLIRSLDANLQQVVICRFANGMSHAETAQVMGIKEGHVRVLQLRALQKLRELLENE